ncbi:DUF523 domain-containing protein [Psychromonas hadalis]|uniref:DUF523 domain-containing protein n=1 Tax=Psychromonas hadalis TaxID=211669 RepID=UPI0003B53C4F|nr:DUF523 domain-containing protein [Psychromonas hadalis]
MNDSCYKIIISACLLGQRVRYDAKVKTYHSPLINQWLLQGIILPVCPEVLGGLPTPRPAAEIQINKRIQTQQNEDVTDSFMQGAEKTLAIALQHNIKLAILTERSPSCGSSKIYDGSFSNMLIDGQGVTTKLLRENGILVFSQFQLKKVQTQLSLLAKLPE